MDYFFIAGNVASIIALGGFILQVSHKLSDAHIYGWSVGFFIALTVGFWIYFYRAPRNRIRNAIQEGLSFAGSYRDSSGTAIDVREGQFTITSFSPVIVETAPFESPATVTLFPVDRPTADLPSVVRVTLDSFEAKASNNQQFGSWKYRLRGRLLDRNEVGRR
jgi:hypothetical protein